MIKREDNQMSILDSWIDLTSRNEFLKTVEEIIDWKPLEQILEACYDHTDGRKGFPPLKLFKMSLLQRWYTLSDGDVLKETKDRLSFMSFTGFGLNDSLPDDTTLVKFRNRLREHQVETQLFESVMVQLEQRHMKIKKGTIIDATLVASKNTPPTKEKDSKDPDARWTKKGGKPHFGYKVHIAEDRDTELIRNFTLTPANTHECHVFEELLMGDEKIVYADKGYASEENNNVLADRNITNRIMRKKPREHQMTFRIRTLNHRISRIRSKIERKNGELKLWHGLKRMIYTGIDRCFTHVMMTIMAVNLKRSVKLVEA